MSLNTYVGGTGNSLVLPGDGTAVSGATVSMWDSWTGQWVPVASNGTDASAPTQLTYSAGSAAEAASYVAEGAQSVNLALQSSVGRGNGPNPPVVSVDYVEITVGYRNPQPVPACTSDESCFGLTYCDTKLNQCVAGCDQTFQCPGGDICNTSTHQCIIDDR
jgi:hypothetical protein